MSKIYECGTCGVVTKIEADVCVPKEKNDKEEFCGFSKPRAVMCEPVKQHLAYSCGGIGDSGGRRRSGTCGRPAQQPELVCNPLNIGK